MLGKGIWDLGEVGVGKLMERIKKVEGWKIVYKKNGR